MMLRMTSALLGFVVWALAAAGSRSEAALSLRAGDVVAFLGGSDVAAAQHTGHLEALLVAAFPGTKIQFRNFGWEGDTVFDQPRDVGFPPLKSHLEKFGATVLVLQYGRAEALGVARPVEEFRSAYEKLIGDFASEGRRFVLVTPPPFESAGGFLPNLTERNVTLSGYAGAIRAIAAQKGFPVIDLFQSFSASAGRVRLTDDGLQLTPQGQARFAAEFVRQAGFPQVAEHAGLPDDRGVWPARGFEDLRQAVMRKNRYWFDYWRPQNWAFLGGDRISQPSSRDHRDPKIRWFPAEMEKFRGWIAREETEIEQLGSRVPR